MIAEDKETLRNAGKQRRPRERNSKKYETLDTILEEKSALVKHTNKQTKNPQNLLNSNKV